MYDGTPCLVIDGVTREPRGYGRCYERRYGALVRYRHRLAWIDAHGCLPPADRPWVLHHCDNPPCEEPTHLYAGTRSDNMGDVLARGRSSRGERRPMAKLTDADVREIRAERAKGTRLRVLAERYGVAQSNISQAARGVSWRHVV